MLYHRHSATPNSRKSITQRNRIELALYECLKTEGLGKTESELDMTPSRTMKLEVVIVEKENAVGVSAARDFDRQVIIKIEAARQRLPVRNRGTGLDGELSIKTREPVFQKLVSALVVLNT